MKKKQLCCPRKQAHFGSTIKMHSCYVFKVAMSFPLGKLPIKRQEIEQILNFSDYQTLDAAIDVAQVLHERWVWCNVH